MAKQASNQRPLKALQRENRELKGTNDILRKVSAFSPERRTTANRSNGVVHRGQPVCFWGRTDLWPAADRYANVLLAWGPVGRRGASISPGTARQTLSVETRRTCEDNRQVYGARMVWRQRRVSHRRSAVAAVRTPTPWRSQSIVCTRRS
jgi:hypothetical protein